MSQQMERFSQLFLKANVGRCRIPRSDPVFVGEPVPHASHPRWSPLPDLALKGGHDHMDPG